MKQLHILAVGRMRFNKAFMFNGDDQFTSYVKKENGEEIRQPWMTCDYVTTPRRFFRQAAILREGEKRR